MKAINDNYILELEYSATVARNTKKGWLVWFNGVVVWSGCRQSNAEGKFNQLVSKYGMEIVKS